MVQTFDVSVKDLIKCKEGKDIYHFRMLEEGIEITRHCEKPIKNEYNGLDYLIKTVIPGNVRIEWSYKHKDEYEQKKYTNKSNFYVSDGGDGATFTSILELFLIKKADRLDIQYWPYNNSQNNDDHGLNGESLIVSIRDKNNRPINRVQINNTWLHQSTRMILNY
jgi:hypothetical protein